MISCSRPWSTSARLVVAGVVSAATSSQLSEESARSVALLSDDGRYDMSASTSFSKLTEVDALPSAKIQSAIGDGNGERNAYHGRFGVSRHIRRAFVLMQIARVAVGYQSLEDSL